MSVERNDGGEMDEFLDITSPLIREGVGKEQLRKSRGRTATAVKESKPKKTGLIEKIKQYPGRTAMATIMGGAGLFGAFSEQGLDLAGDLGRQRTPTELKAAAREKAIEEFKLYGKTPESLFDLLYRGAPEMIDEYTGQKGILKYGRPILAGMTPSEFVIAFDDCLDVEPYSDDETKITTSRSKDGSQVFLSVNPTGDARLNFEYVADNKNGLGFNLEPTNKSTLNELGFRGCEGYFNPVTEQVNPPTGL